MAGKQEQPKKPLEPENRWCKQEESDLTKTEYAKTVD